MLSGSFPGELEGEAMDTLHARARKHRNLGRRLLRQPAMHAPAGAGVFALAVLADDDPVDPGIFQGCVYSGKDPGGPDVGVLVEALADRQAQVPQRHMVRHVRRADRAEEDGIESLQLFEAAFRDIGAGLFIAGRAPVERSDLQGEFFLGSQFRQNLQTRGNDFHADPVARDRRDAIRLQAAILDWLRTTSATAAPISLVEALPFMSGVCGPSMMTCSMARTISAAAAGCPRCSSMSAPDQIVAIGLAIFLPAMSG